jgi:transitional endoplasmic reticulum ATPase
MGPGPLEVLRAVINDLKDHQVLVIPNLDLLGGGQDRSLSREARDLIDLVYGAHDRLVLAFIDPSLPVPDVLAGRFAVRVEVVGLPRDVPGEGDGSVLIGKALVEEDEARLFPGLKPGELYKNIAGMNPIRFREAMAYAVQVARDQLAGDPQKKPDVKLLYHELRVFKAQTSEQFVIPDVSFERIGGYREVKGILERAIALLSGAGHLPKEELRHELIPRGFLFHGPPGTGKTLFAKAVANKLNATIRVVSGPEITDMYVGESERKMRAVFAQARRNAPSVIVFDEFDSIAGRRTGRDDGGSRAGNALVAQILTEMDGFRPEVPILVIGTTNRLELIDEALLRPSRFQPVPIGLPDVEARRQIAGIHAAHFDFVGERKLSDELLDVIATATVGMNGDEIRSLFRDACLGIHCEDPPQPATPARFGFLVGRLRARRDTQKTSQTELRTHDPTLGRRRPSAGLVRLTTATPREGTDLGASAVGTVPVVIVPTQPENA